MRFIISSEQLKFFEAHNYLEVEELLTKEEAIALMNAIEESSAKSPGYPQENFFRSLPLITHLAKKRGWGQVAAFLLRKKPMRLLHDRFFSPPFTITETLDDQACALLIDLKSRRGFFFKQAPLPPTLYNSAKNCYFFLILTAKHLPEHLNPVIVS
jgi:hypothetical protein